MRKSIPVLMILVLATLLLGACQSNTPTDATLPEQPSNNPATNDSSGYPVIATDENGYPIEEAAITYPPGPDFSISVPVKAGDTVVSGTGPAGVPILLVDVSEAGALLGETVIGDDGNFTFDLAAGLLAQHQIGLQLGDLAGTDLNANDYVYSDTYYSKPFIGILFDMVLVE